MILKVKKQSKVRKTMIFKRIEDTMLITKEYGKVAKHFSRENIYTYLKILCLKKMIFKDSSKVLLN